MMGGGDPEGHNRHAALLPGDQEHSGLLTPHILLLESTPPSHDCSHRTEAEAADALLLSEASITGRVALTSRNKAMAFRCRFSLPVALPHLHICFLVDAFWVLECLSYLFKMVR